MELVSEEYIFGGLALFPLSSQAYLFAFWNRFLPHRPELISSQCCSETVVSCVYLWVIFFIFFRVLEELSLHCKTLACLDMGRQPDIIEKLPEGKV